MQTHHKRGSFKLTIMGRFRLQALNYGVFWIASKVVIAIAFADFLCFGAKYRLPLAQMLLCLVPLLLWLVWQLLVTLAHQLVHI